MRLVYHRHFLKSAKRLPKSQQRKLAACLSRLRANPYHPLLHSKRLTGRLAGFLSFRITREWRVIYCFLNDETIQLLRVAHHKDIYR